MGERMVHIQVERAPVSDDRPWGVSVGWARMAQRVYSTTEIPARFKSRANALRAAQELGKLYESEGCVVVYVTPKAAKGKVRRG